MRKSLILSIKSNVHALIFKNSSMIPLFASMLVLSSWQCTTLVLSSWRCTTLVLSSWRCTTMVLSSWRSTHQDSEHPSSRAVNTLNENRCSSCFVCVSAAWRSAPHQTDEGEVRCGYGEQLPAAHPTCAHFLSTNAP